MALRKACIIGGSVKNTGKECDIAMGPTAMIICVPPSTVITEEDLEDPVEWIRPLLHESKENRVYPLFGSVAPINVITNDQEADVEVTLDDGTKVPVRLGVYNRTFETIAGGLCYAEALLSFLGAGYRVLEIDQAGRMLVRRQGTKPKTWGGIITSYMGGKGPVLATLKDIYRNRFGYSFTPQEMVNNGEIFDGAGPLLGLMGLIDAEVTEYDVASITTAAVGASGTVTITTLGSDGSTIDVQVDGVSLLSAPVTKTSTETTITLLAAKVAAALTANSSDNGGYTATNLVGAITVKAPKILGADANGDVVTAPVTGTTAATVANFASGVTGVAVLKLSIHSHCAESDILKLFGDDFAEVENFVVTDPNGEVVTMTAAAYITDHIELTGPLSAGSVYTVQGAEPLVWYNNDISGYDGSEHLETVTIPGSL